MTTAPRNPTDQPAPPDPTPIPVYFAPLVKACAAQGISRSRAYKLMQQGMLTTFSINSSRYVMMDSLRSLPERLGSQSQHGT